MKSALTRLERLKTVQVVGERCEERPGARPLSYGESQDENRIRLYLVQAPETNDEIPV